MRVPVYYETDADLAIAQKKRVVFIGYGNRGVAQAKNLRESGVQVKGLERLEQLRTEELSSLVAQAEKRLMKDREEHM